MQECLNRINFHSLQHYEKMIRQYAEIEGVTEELKATDNLEWTRCMNSIRNRVEEFILRDIIYE